MLVTGRGSHGRPSPQAAGAHQPAGSPYCVPVPCIISHLLGSGLDPLGPSNSSLHSGVSPLHHGDGGAGCGGGAGGGGGRAGGGSGGDPIRNRGAGRATFGGRRSCENAKAAAASIATEGKVLLPEVVVMCEPVAPPPEPPTLGTGRIFEGSFHASAVLEEPQPTGQRNAEARKIHMSTCCSGIARGRLETSVFLKKDYVRESQQYRYKMAVNHAWAGFLVRVQSPKASDLNSPWKYLRWGRRG